MIRLKIVFFTAIILLCGKPALFAQQDTLYLTLENALEIAKSQSAQAMIAKHQFRMNYWQYRSFKADYLPLVTLDATLPNFSRSYDNVRQNDGTYKYQYTTFNNYATGITIDQRVGPTGGSLYLKSNLQRSDNIYEDTTSSSFQSIPVVIGYNQPIFKYNEYRWAKQLEPLKYEKAKRQYMENIEQVSITTVGYFFNLLLAQIEEGIAEKNLNSYDTMYKIAQGRYQLGRLAENDLLQLELSYLKAKAQVDRASLDYEVNLYQLKSFLRLKDDRTIRLLPPAQTWHGVITTSDAVAEARKNSATYMEFDEQMITAESEVRRAKMNGRFDADLFLQYGLIQSSDAVSSVYQDPLDYQTVELGITVPILDWGSAKGKIKVAESNFDLETIKTEQAQIDFEQNIFLRVMEFNMQKDQLYIAAKADTVAQKRYDVTQKRYMIGQVNDVQELNNAQIENDTGRKGYYEALQIYWINYFQIRKMTLYDFINNKMLIFDIRDVL